MDGGREVYVEFQVRGNVVKATAIDPASGVEVSVMGPAGAARAALTQAAIAKLKYVLEKKKDSSSKT